MVKSLLEYKEKKQAEGTGFGFSEKSEDDIANTLSSRYYKDGSENILFVGGMNKTRKGCEDQAHLSRAYSQKDRVISDEGISPTISAQESQGRYNVLVKDKKRENEELSSG